MNKKIVLRMILALLFASILTLAFNTELVNSSESIIVYYDGQAITGNWEGVEIITCDAPASSPPNVYPGPYPYEFNLGTPSSVYMSIRHFLWAPNNTVLNNLTISVDGEPVLQAASPPYTIPVSNVPWYPGGDGISTIYLGTLSSGNHHIAMQASFGNYYLVDWWEIFKVTSGGGPRARLCNQKTANCRQ
jgi:hypothetical protein